MIDRAIESARCRIYRLKDHKGSTLAHQTKAKNQQDLMKTTIKALELYRDTFETREKEDTQTNQSLYSPCADCLNRRGHAYTNECDSTCEYAKCVKTYTKSLRDRDAKLQEYEERLDRINKQLENAYQIIGEIIDR